MFSWDEAHAYDDVRQHASGDDEEEESREFDVQEQDDVTSVHSSAESRSSLLLSSEFDLPHLESNSPTKALTCIADEPATMISSGDEYLVPSSTGERGSAAYRGYTQLEGDDACAPGRASGEMYFSGALPCELERECTMHLHVARSRDDAQYTEKLQEVGSRDWNSEFQDILDQYDCRRGELAELIAEFTEAAEAVTVMIVDDFMLRGSDLPLGIERVRVGTTQGCAGGDKYAISAVDVGRVEG